MQHQRRLAGAVGAEESDALTGVHVQVDPEQGLVTVRVRVGQTADVEDRRRHDAGACASRTLRHPAGVAAGEHGEVDAFAALVACG